MTAGTVVLLRDQQFNPEVARVLRKMRPERQVGGTRPDRPLRGGRVMIDFSQLFSPLSLPELQQAQTLLNHEMDKHREQERDRLFEEFAALAQARQDAHLGQCLGEAGQGAGGVGRVMGPEILIA